MSPCPGPVDTWVQFCTCSRPLHHSHPAAATKRSPASLIIWNKRSLRGQTTLVWSWMNYRVQYCCISLEFTYLLHQLENSHFRKGCFSCCFHTLTAAVPGKDHEQDLTPQTLVSIPVWPFDTKLSPAPRTVMEKDLLLLLPWANDQQWAGVNTSHREFPWKESSVTARSFLYCNADPTSLNAQ